MNDDTHRPLIDAANEFEAAAIVEGLQARGIDAVAAGDIGGGQPLSGPARIPVLVPAADLQAARRILDASATDAVDTHDEASPRRRMPAPAMIGFIAAVAVVAVTVIAVVVWLVS